jgi:hypothetical protein
MVKLAYVPLVAALLGAAQAGASAKIPQPERRVQLGSLRPAPAVRALGASARKAEAAPKTLPEFSNPLKRRRMAMPVVPDGDLGF